MFACPCTLWNRSRASLQLLLLVGYLPVRVIWAGLCYWICCSIGVVDTGYILANYIAQGRSYIWSHCSLFNREGTTKCITGTYHDGDHMIVVKSVACSWRSGSRALVDISTVVLSLYVVQYAMLGIPGQGILFELVVAEKTTITCFSSWSFVSLWRIQVTSLDWWWSWTEMLCNFCSLSATTSSNNFSAVWSCQSHTGEQATDDSFVCCSWAPWVVVGTTWSVLIWWSMLNY